jgi:hypothetical protein
MQVISLLEKFIVIIISLYKVHEVKVYEEYCVRHCLSVCLSVRPSVRFIFETTLNLVFVVYTGSCWEYLILVDIRTV